MRISRSLLLQSLMACALTVALPATTTEISSSHLQPRSPQAGGLNNGQPRGSKQKLGGNVNKEKSKKPSTATSPKPVHNVKKAGSGTLPKATGNTNKRGSGTTSNAGAKPAIVQTKASVADTAAGLKTTSGGRAMVESVNAFRRDRGLPALGWSPQLAKNAAITGQATDGKAMQHKMGPGTMGQVLVMGFDEASGCTRQLSSYTPFELFYYSWLCEVPGDSALKGRCPDILRMSRINVAGQRGHYDILTANRYKTIGCAFTQNPGAQKCGAFVGVWSCDLGM